MRESTPLIALSRGALLAAISVFFSLSMATVGCGPPPKPDTLVRLEEMLRQPPMTDLRAHNSASLVEADRYREQAVKAWQESDLAEAQDYTLSASMLYRRADAENKLAVAEDQIRQDSKRFEAAHTKEPYYQEEIRKLEERIAKQTSELASGDRLAREALQAEAKRAEEARRPSPDEIAATRQLLERAQLALTASETVKANLYAAGRYNKARNLLGRAAQEILLGPAEAQKTIDEANQEIEAARVEASPRFLELEGKRKVTELTEQLVGAAQKIQGAEVRREPRGVVVVVPDIGAPGSKAVIKEERFLAIDQIGKMMQDFPGVQVAIEGHTDTTAPKPAREALSRAFASAVRDMLVEKGTDSGRITVAGLGDTAPAEDNSSAKSKARNRRIEVVFKLR